MAGTMTPRPLGPFPGGVLDRANAALAPAVAGTMKRARGVRYRGKGQLVARGGSRVLLTLKDDGGTPATVTSVVGVWQFADRALAVAHSTATSKVYVYVLASTLDSWYNAAGALQSNAAPEPVGVLWTPVTTAPDVTATEGLGVAYFAHTEAASSATLSFKGRSLTLPGTLADQTSDLNGDASAEDLYPVGCVAFQQHLWIWGVGSGTTAADHYRPELARYSQPNFTFPFLAPDSITLGDRVRSEREKIVGGYVAGDALYLGSPAALTRVTGYGRTSWFKKPLDKSFGFAGPKAMTARGSTLYYWSYGAGPMRCQQGGEPEQLSLEIEGAVAAAINPEKVVASYDEGTDLVMFTYDAGAGVRTLACYDGKRQVWLGPDDDVGLVIRFANSVSPVRSSTSTVSTAPAGAPTVAVTSGVGATAATASWTTGDPTAQTQVEYRRQGDTTWTIVPGLIAAGVSSYQITGLTANVAYEWRAAHYKGGSYSAYLGPAAGTQFETDSATLLPPTNLALSIVGNFEGYSTIRATWTNSGEAGVSTSVEHRLGSGTFEADGNPPSPTASLEFNVSETGTYGVRVSHNKPGYNDSDATAEVTIDVTVDDEAVS